MDGGLAEQRGVVRVRPAKVHGISASMGSNSLNSRMQNQLFRRYLRYLRLALASRRALFCQHFSKLPEDGPATIPLHLQNVGILLLVPKCARLDVGEVSV